MITRSFTAGLAMAFLCATSLVAAQDAEVSGELRKWHRVTLTFDGPQTSEDAAVNPFRDYRLTVEFKHPKTGATHEVPGYYAADGDAAQTSAARGNKWRVHFLPQVEGTWQFTASFRTGKDVAISDDAQAGRPAGFDGAKGAFDIGPTNKTGRDHRAKGLLSYVGEHYLRFAESGEPFLKGGADSPENFLAYADFDGTYSAKRGKPKKGEALAKGLHAYAPHVRDWQRGDPTWKDGQGRGVIGALNYLSSQGMNSVYFLTMNITGDGDDVWPYADRDERDRFDCSKLDQWEIVFSHMDARGILLHVILQETENDQLLDKGELGVERKLYFRELVARFAHHHALVWNLGEENTNSDKQRREFCSYIRRLDPYDHPIVCHTFPGKYDQVYTPLLAFADFEGPSLQTNDTHNQTLRWVARSRATGRPWVVNLDEIGPANTGVKPDDVDSNHDEVRKKHLWGNLMAGGAGVEWYFGYNFAHNDLNCEDWRSRENVWKPTRHALDFFHKHLPFTEMVAADGLTAAKDDYVFTQPGNVYAIYLPSGGAAKLSLPDAPYEVRWYNPREGGDLQTGSVDRIRGPGEVAIGAPPAEPNRDWVALVRFAGDGKPPEVTLPKTAIDVQPARRLPPRDVKPEDLAISGFTLINADTDQPLRGFANVQGEVNLSLSKLPTRNINVIANVKSDVAGSVRFSLGNDANYRTENVAPFALVGDTDGDYNAWRLTVGTHTISAIAYGDSGARGAVGNTATLKLIVGD